MADLPTLTGAGITPVIEPAVLTRSSIGEKGKSYERTVSSFRWFNPPAQGCDAQSSKTEPGGRDAYYASVILVDLRAIRSRAIQHQPCCRVGLLPEIKKGSVWKVLEGCFVRLRERVMFRRDRERRLDDYANNEEPNERS